MAYLDNTDIYFSPSVEGWKPCFVKFSHISHVDADLLFVHHIWTINVPVT